MNLILFAARVLWREKYWKWAWNDRILDAGAFTSTCTAVCVEVMICCATLVGIVLNSLLTVLRMRPSPRARLKRLVLVAAVDC